MYADDSQIYINFDLNQVAADEAKCKLESCLADIRTWMKENKLQLNESKTELLIITLSRQSYKIDVKSVKVGNCEVEPANKARNLGATFDSHMTLKPHVSAIVKSCNYQLRRIGLIRKYLSRDASEKLIHAFITSRLDNGNSLLYGLPDYLTDKLQRIHNTAARILTQTKKFDHITPTLRDLHWLPVKNRIIFKILILTFRCLHGLAPAYLSQLLHPYLPARSLRSSNLLLLKITKTRSKSYGDRAFQNSAPKIWNSLPLNIRQCETLASFKSKLKEHLFKESYL